MKMGDRNWARSAGPRGVIARLPHMVENLKDSRDCRDRSFARSNAVFELFKHGTADTDPVKAAGKLADASNLGGGRSCVIVLLSTSPGGDENNGSR